MEARPERRRLLEFARELQLARPASCRLHSLLLQLKRSGPAHMRLPILPRHVKLCVCMCTRICLRVYACIFVFNLRSTQVPDTGSYEQVGGCCSKCVARGV